MDTFAVPSTASIISFLALCLVIYLAFPVGVYFSKIKETSRKAALKFSVVTGLVLLLKILVVAAVVASGVLMTYPVPGLPLFMGLILLFSFLMGFSNVGTALTKLPLSALFLFQAFRLPLELILHDWVQQGTIPETMTWTGQNWDIVSGVLFLITAPMVCRFKMIAWLTNLIGMVLLANVIRVAILSSPVPFGWHVTPPMMLPFFLPFALIIPICVGGALCGHVILTRALIRQYK